MSVRDVFYAIALACALAIISLRRGQCRVFRGIR
jgi:hypothetical protein